ncbi:hypothetical protein B0T26DRAFT_670222 [Lasiosphaeria miniovina]|uniref:Pentatricopeptide repeat-containing protein n=1 Tax=Lasiosphaeria miniovina TaxID=1954250 RepID=A0AA40BH35_9PEZI|nr:uncharacterized protein B0T26DRAFT_670222 [Lasiosphaeria miniovina]KAK0733868.1 hypothetical protein B0T26DRAFT_670222 [Lasiosphaeria miniovina]
MPPRTFSLDLSRSSYVCKSCLTNLRISNQPKWLARHGSSVAQKAQQPQYPTGQKRPKPKATTETISLEDLQKAFTQLKTEAREQEQAQAPPIKTDDDISPIARPTQPLSVRYYNEIQPGTYKRMPDKDGFTTSAKLDTKIEAAINELEQQMASTVEMLQQMEEGGMQDKADDLRKQFKKTLRDQYKGKTGPEAEEHRWLRILGFSGARHRAVANLNRFLARENVVKGGVPKPKDLLECWKSYSAARKSLSTAWENVPRGVWDFLWTTLSWEEGVDNPNRMSHIYVLAKDMSAAGVVLRDSQQLLAIEAMFIEGWQAEAIEAWKKAVTLGSKPETFKEYWELGVRMCCIYGDTERAQRAADMLLNSAHDMDPRIIIPIVRALAAKEPTREQAWTLFRDMRDLLGTSMTVEDYDIVIGSFLACNCVEFALQAFVDMMFAGAIDVRGKTRLPTAVGNHFFLGKWLKRLIGAGQLDEAYQVAVFLQTKGVVASPIQLNGLIGAWIRSGSAEDLDKAERLAWDMIHTRLEYVYLRHRAASMDQPTRFYAPYVPPTIGGDGSGFKCKARATAETISLLAENYCSRGLHDRLKELWEGSQRAEITTTAFFMNQLIRSHSHNMKADDAVALYRSMTKEQNIRPDGHTFLTLFSTLSVNRLIQRDEVLSARDVVSGRQFFSDMVEADWVFDSPELFGILPRTILFSMLKAHDYTGMLVAARAMKEIFAYTPPEPLLIELATGSTMLKAPTKRNLERLMSGTMTVEGLMKHHRAAVAPGQRLDPDNMTVDQRAAELHAVLEQLILLKAGLQDVDPNANLRPALEAAARDMGVYDIVIAPDPKKISKHRKLDKKALQEM